MAFLQQLESVRLIRRLKSRIRTVIRPWLMPRLMEIVYLSPLVLMLIQPVKITLQLVLTQNHITLAFLSVKDPMLVVTRYPSAKTRTRCFLVLQSGKTLNQQMEIFQLATVRARQRWLATALLLETTRLPRVPKPLRSEDTV